MSVNGTLVEDKMRRFKGECAHFWFNNCFFYTHDGASAKFSTNSHETDNSAVSTVQYHQSELTGFNDTDDQFLKVWCQGATLFIYFSYFITYIHSVT